MKKISITSVIVVLTIAAFIGFIAYAISRPDPRVAMTSRQFVQECTTDMATQYHVHAKLKIIADKKEVGVIPSIGIDNARNCMSALHTHKNDGTIHIESPVQKDFTLGDFFFKWNQPFSKNQILDNKVDAEHAIKMFVNGVGSQDFENLILNDKQEIVIDYYSLKDGPDVVDSSPRA